MSIPAVKSLSSGRRVRAFGEEITFHLEAKDTGGQMTQWTEITPPGGGPPPHYHQNEDELFLVREGKLQFLVNGEWREVESGGIVFAPRNSVHTFKNIGDGPSNMLVSTYPSGFEDFFTQCAGEFAKPSGPDMERIVQISAEHGIYFVK